MTKTEARLEAHRRWGTESRAIVVWDNRSAPTNERRKVLVGPRHGYGMFNTILIGAGATWEDALAAAEANPNIPSFVEGR